MKKLKNKHYGNVLIMLNVRHRWVLLPHPLGIAKLHLWLKYIYRYWNN